MSKQEAIEELKLYEEYTYGGLKEAFSIAIESMEKLIKLEKWLEEQTNE